MKKIRIALVGTGNIAVQHARAIQKLRDAQLCAVYSHSRERAESFAKRFGLSVYTDYDQMLQDKVIDLVDIVTVNYLHADLGIKAAYAGKHIIIEKPIDISLEKAAALLDACKENRVKLTVISQYRFNGAVSKVKDIVNDGQIGRLIMANVSLKWPRSQAYYDSSGEWRKSWDQSGGGVLMVQAIHLIDVLQWIMGPVDFVQGKVNTLTHKIDTEDTAIGIIGFSSGAIGVVEATTCVSSRLPDRIEIHGDKGSLVVENNRIIGYYYGSNSYWDRFMSVVRSRFISFIPRTSGTIEKQIANMVEAIKQDKEPLVGGEEGKKALEIVLSIYESSRQGKTIYLNRRAV